MIKIFLIALFSNEKFPFIGESHGICAISGYLNEKYFGIVETYLFDQQINSNEEILSEIKSKRPEIIGFSVKMQTLNNWDTFYNLIKNNISSYNPLVILGNSTAHFNSDYLLNNYDNILISFGEGEVSFGDLIKYVKGKIPVDKIRNIGYRKKGKIICTDREYLPTIEIPIADRRYSDLYYTKGGEVYIEGSRGCAYCCCSICECRLFLGSHQAINKWRPKPVSKILNELSELEILGIKEVTFSDEDFIGDDILGASHALQIAEELIDKQIRIQYRINARVHSIFRLKDNIVNRNNKIQLLKQLKKSGLVKIFLGFESGSESQLKRYNKGFKLLEFLNAKKILDELSIEYELGYISLDPLMTLEELKESLDFINNNSCIHYISNIYKELRIQSGNQAYLSNVRTYELNHNVQVLEKLDMNEQIYSINKYADPRVEILRQCMSEYEAQTYQLYYRMRILTQYSETNENIYTQITHKTLSEIKKLDFNLMMELISDIELCNSANISNIISKYNVIRYKVYMAFANQVANSNNELSTINLIKSSFDKMIDLQK
ncbi:B12-binding domain-containing radical SAM protein [Odoribacter laneus]